MKKIFVFLLLVSASVLSYAQLKDPVKWSFTAKKISADFYEVHITAAIDPGWHIYSQTTPDGGPVATAIKFSKNPLLTLSGRLKEVGKLEQHHEALFDVDVKQYSNKVDFVQSVKVKASAKTAIKGSVEFMVCDNQQCLPPKTVGFSVSLK